MKIIGITGGIATGKSVVTKLLRKDGFVVIDCDVIAKEILTEPATIDEVVAAFGTEILLDGQIDRFQLGKIIFHDAEKKQILNGIVHPHVRNRVIEELKKHQNEVLVFVDVPLLYEAKMEDMMDYVILVYVRPRIQLKRLMERDSIERPYAQIKINSQMSLDEKAKLADFIIDNEGSIDNTDKQLQAILRRLSI